MTNNNRVFGPRITEGCEALVEMSWNGGGHFTCSEADRIYELILVVLGQEQADLFMRGHAEEDEEFDLHRIVNEDWAYSPV